MVDEILGEDGVQGVRAHQRSTGEVVRFAADAVFAYAGLAPNTHWMSDVQQLDPSGYILTDIQMHTARPGLFAAGDVRAGSASQAVTAAGDGATAAIAAHRYLR